MHYAVISLLAATAVPALFLLAIHIGFRAPRRVEQVTPADFGLPYRAVNIPTSGGKRLFAWFLPATNTSPTVILMHGWGSNCALMLPLAVPLHNAGLNVLLPDARNHGRSDGAGYSSLPRFAEDVAACIGWTGRHATPRPGVIALLGHSVGAGAVLLEASRREDIAAVISIAAFAHPEWMMRRYLKRAGVPGVFAAGVLRYVEWLIGYRYETIAPMNTACRLNCPLLLVHGKADRTVPVSDALAIRDNCPDKAPELLLVDDADHESVDSVERNATQLLDFLARAGVTDQPAA